MKYLFYTIACIFAFVSNAEMHENIHQSYLPILEDGKRWVYIHSNLSFPEEVPDRYTMAEVIGDTIFDNVSCKIVKHSELSDESSLYDNSFLSYYSEKDGRIDQIIYDNKKVLRHPLIDMTLNKNDQYLFYFWDYENLTPCDEFATIYDSDYVIKNDVIRKRIMLSPKSSDSDASIWIEGIGSNSQSYLTIPNILPPCGIVATKLIECYLRDELIFDYDDFLAKGLSSIQNINSGKSLEGLIVNLIGNTIYLIDERYSADVFSLSGQQIGSLKGDKGITLPTGIYIIRCGNSAQKIAIR